MASSTPQLETHNSAQLAPWQTEHSLSLAFTTGRALIAYRKAIELNPNLTVVH
ncbi:MAG: hypothetical protein F6K11_30425 [Leptolyngbya sp. SIO3F4]|nr:hypothetical protein [Leptolyngbya sp. SIO3F4]